MKKWKHIFWFCHLAQWAIEHKEASMQYSIVWWIKQEFEKWGVRVLTSQKSVKMYELCPKQHVFTWSPNVSSKVLFGKLPGHILVSHPAATRPTSVKIGRKKLYIFKSLVNNWIPLLSYVTLRPVTMRYVLCNQDALIGKRKYLLLSLKNLFIFSCEILRILVGWTW